MDSDSPIIGFLQIALALNAAVGRRTGIEPLLSTATYDYGLPTPAWDWDELGRQIEHVQANLTSLPPQRAAFLQDILQAFALMVREGQGDKIPYAERVATYLQVPGQQVPLTTIQSLEHELRSLLVEADYPDDLSIAIPQWQERQRVRQESLLEQGQPLLQRARQVTQQRVWPLPAEHQVDLSFPQDYPYYGYSDYARDYRGHVYMSADIEWTLAGLKHVVCHESFPGHQAFSAIREQTFREDRLPVEGTLYFSNTPITPIVEGLCEIGQDVLGMIETVDDRIYDLHNRLSFAVSTNLAFDCNTEGLDQETAVTQLMNAAHVSRAFAEQRYHFWTHPLWCTGFPHYWYGSEFIRECYNKMQDHLPDFFRMIYTEPHTVRTLREAVQNYRIKDSKGFENL